MTIVRLDGQAIDVPQTLTFAELIERLRKRAAERAGAVVEIELDGRPLSQAQLDRLQDQPIHGHGEIAVTSMSVRSLVQEIITQASAYLQRIQDTDPRAEDLPALVEGTLWLDQALEALLRWLPPGAAQRTVDVDIPEPEAGGPVSLADWLQRGRKLRMRARAYAPDRAPAEAEAEAGEAAGMEPEGPPPSTSTPLLEAIREHLVGYQRVFAQVGEWL